MDAAQRERVEILALYAKDLTTASSKALTHGIDEVDPVTGRVCGELIEDALGDLYWAANYMLSKSDILIENSATRMSTTAERTEFKFQGGDDAKL